MAALLLIVVQARAYEIARGADGQLLHGARLPLRLQVNVDEDLITGEDRGPLRAPAACRRAALAWEAVSDSRAHFVRAGSPLDRGEGSAVVVAALRESWPAAYGSQNATLAFTVVEVDEGQGRIDAASVYLNAVGFAFSSSDAPRQIDIAGTVAHELGHALGLEHSCGEPFGSYVDCAQLPDAVREGIEEATMYPAASRGNIWQRDLAADDRQGLVALYPAEGLSPPELFVSCGCAPEPILICEQSEGVLLAYQAGQVFRRDQMGGSCGDGPASQFDPTQDFDLELSDPNSGKRSVLFAQRCPPCTSPDAGQAASPSPQGSCACAFAGKPDLLPLWCCAVALLWRRMRSR